MSDRVADGCRNPGRRAGFEALVGKHDHAGAAAQNHAMHLLLIGGTRFLGRHVVEQALARGHTVTLLHRGRTGAALFPQVERHLADRDGDLSVLARGRWDAVVDTCAYHPAQVVRMADALRGRVGGYLLVSTISVYADLSRPGLAEDAPLAVPPDPHATVVDATNYGGLKALCEAALHTALPDEADVVRPGLIVGPHDPTGRFTWWVQRLRRGGDVLAPGDPSAPVQCIDVRDLAAHLLDRVERGRRGTVHVTGPTTPATLGELLATGRDVLRPDARLRWVDEATLLRAGVVPWTGLPLWVPQADAGVHAVDLSRAVADGLRCRPLADTLRDTAAWADAVGDAAVPAGIGLVPAQEAALLGG